MDIGDFPTSLKPIQHYLKLAKEHDERDIVVAYWARLYALQLGLKLSQQSPEERKSLLEIMDWLEKTKTELADNEAITNDVAAQAHLENYALRLFLYADKQDRSSNFGKNVVKAFYSSSVVYDILQTFGELSEEAVNNRKYAKWKAAYIHNCLKNGETPMPGPMTESGEEQPATNSSNSAGDENSPDSNHSESNPINQPMSPQRSESNDFASDPFPNAASVVAPTADEVLSDPNKLPSPPVEEEKPGAFVPYVQPEGPAVSPTVTKITNVQLTADQMMKAQKYCKYAGSALNYDDIKTAIENLQKALTLLTTGQDS